MSDFQNRVADIFHVPDHPRAGPDDVLAHAMLAEIERLQKRYEELATHHNNHCTCQEIY